MINLLPTNYAESIRYGRRNTKLLYWLIGLLAAITGMILIIIGGWFYIGEQQKTYQHNINTTNQQLKVQNLTQVQKDSKEITGDIKVITQVLGSEIRFSELIQAIGNDMPPGAVLSNLSLSNKVSGAIDLTANTKDAETAAQVAVNLAKSNNELFSKVDIISVNCSSAATETYKCTANYRALFSKTAQTKFLTVPKESR